MDLIEYMMLTASLLCLVLIIVLILSRRRSEDSLAATRRELQASYQRLEDDFARQSAALDSRLREMELDSRRQLDEIKASVEQRLDENLQSRLDRSLGHVMKSLESVYTEIGKIQSLSEGVGSLQRLLSNVKTRGVWGELQCKRILEEIMTPDQYIENAKTRPGTQERVEFAVKLPGSDGQAVLLPIDSKFPREAYDRLIDAQVNGDAEAVKLEKTELANRIKLEARTISEKYINVPSTTSFAVMFLPVEGLYAEVLSYPGIMEDLQRQYHVVVSGPTTLASLLNSLQMGFRTLAIQQQSAQIYRTLGEVKDEFGRYSAVLGAVKDKIVQATSQIDSAFVRTRAIERKLKDVESLPLSGQSDYNPHEPLLFPSQEGQYD